MERKDYISYETAMHIKEVLGYDDECVTMFNGCDHIIYVDPVTNSEWDKINQGAAHLEGWCAAPTIYAVQKWIRNEFEINIVITFHSKSGGYKCKFESIDDLSDVSDFRKVFPTYEEALTAGIEKVIKQMS